MPDLDLDALAREIAVEIDFALDVDEPLGTRLAKIEPIIREALQRVRLREQPVSDKQAGPRRTSPPRFPDSLRMRYKPQPSATERTCLDTARARIEALRISADSHTPTSVAWNEAIDAALAALEGK
jgi:hypothetical protein